MSELVGINLKEKHVLMKADNFKPRTSKHNMIFLCVDGFGCHPHTIGSKILAIQISTGIKDWCRRQEVQRLATVEEIKAAISG